MTEQWMQIGIVAAMAAIGYAVIRAAKIVPPTGAELPDPQKAGRWSLVALLFTYLLIGGLMALVMLSRGSAANTANGDELQRGVDELYTPGAIGNVLFSYLILIAPAALVMRLRREPLRTAGVRRENLLFSVLLGSGLGAIILTSIVLTAGHPLPRLSAGHGWALLYFGVVGFGEEFVFRGYLQTRLMGWLGRWPGWLIASLAMALIHIGQRMAVGGFDFQQALSSSLGLLPFSLLLGALMLWSGNVALPGVLHTLMDWPNTLIGSF